MISKSSLAAGEQQALANPGGFDTLLYIKGELPAPGLAGVQIRDFPLNGGTFSAVSFAMGDTIFSAGPYVSTSSASASGLTAPHARQAFWHSDRGAEPIGIKQPGKNVTGRRCNH